MTDSAQTNGAAPAPRLEPANQAKTSPPPRPPRRLRDMLALQDFERAARRHLPRPVFSYVAGATETGQSFGANRSDFASIAFVPRALGGHRTRDQSVTLMGRGYRHPFGIAPMGLSALAAYDGDVALHKGARARGIPALVSAAGLTPLERLADEAGSRWFQGYLAGDEAIFLPMLDRVEAAGYDTLVVTVDVPVNGGREENVRDGFSTPLRPSLKLAWQGVTHPRWLLGTGARTLLNRGMPHFENGTAARGAPVISRNAQRSFSGRETLNWRHLETIRRRWTGRLVLKGVLSPEDARLGRELGADGIVVSNHGGRQLDCAVSSIAALPGVKREAGDMAVMLDSGVRRGSDVLKALALGADFVFVGRPMLFAAAIAGEVGVTHAIDILASEIDRDMTLLGLRELSEISQGHLRGHERFLPEG